MTSKNFVVWRKVKVTADILDELALSRSEYEQIVKKLKRAPNALELGLFGALWSEHCGYKHTAKLIKKLPSKSERTLTLAGAENAGVIDIGDGLAVAMKIESHNHPSAVEPYQGAATGVGGIVRDILAIGARPIALLNSLRFGKPNSKHQKFLFDGVIAGISGYGNCIGVPNVGGEIVFDSCYEGNPLVNAMCVGLISDSKIISASAKAAGDLLVLVGADTGRDGIHGASGLASRTFESEREAKSAVQVGNPFLEKVLIEACLEAKHIGSVVGIQDCGAAGLTSAAIEMAERSDLGLVIDVDNVPRRSANMSAYDVMLSESQERMLLAVEKNGFDEVQELFNNWDLNAHIIGHFTPKPTVTIFENGVQLCSTPIDALTSPPHYNLKRNPNYSSGAAQMQSNKLQSNYGTATEVFVKMLNSPNVASRAYVFSQYDHQVQNRTVVLPGGDAAVLKIHATSKALAVAVDGNGALCKINPEVGASIAVAEACRNVAVTGATPIALTDGLNFGDPANENVQHQITAAIAGISKAARAFEIPVISGNASLYNEYKGNAIHPTPIIGALGLLEDVTKAITIDFKREGDLVAVIGAKTPWDTAEGLAGSEYCRLFNANADFDLKFDIELEYKLQKTCCELSDKRLISSAHDCSLGGSAMAITKCAIAGQIGVNVDYPVPDDANSALFGEAQSRVIVSLSPNNVKQFEKCLSEAELPFQFIGKVGGTQIKLGHSISVDLAAATELWSSGLKQAFQDKQ